MLDKTTPNALTIEEFRQRNGQMSVGTFYNLKAGGHIKVTKLFGKTVILIEDEQAFLEKMRAGVFAVDGPTCPKRRAKKAAEQARARQALGAQAKRKAAGEREAAHG
jgi:hypothetical protein